MMSSQSCEVEDIHTCDFCSSETDVVRRIVIDNDYNRMGTKAMYACIECSEKKDRERLATNGL